VVVRHLSGPLDDALLRYLGCQSGASFDYILQRLITQGPANLAKTIIATSIDSARGQRFSSTHDMLTLWFSTSPTFYWNALLGEVFVSLGASGGGHEFKGDVVADHIWRYLSRGL
jgi:hypothetical protein